MTTPSISFEGVWKKFRAGERHDSLRDLIPATFHKLFSRDTNEQLKRDEFWVLRDASFEVGQGQAFGIIGHNGAGKSTTLKLLTRILKPTRGQCLVRGRVGALIEIAAGFHPDLTGRENVFLQGATIGMKRVDINARFDDIVSFAGLEKFIDTPIKRYSSGMNARLGFAIAAHLDPEVLLIDEVLAVGDLTFQQRCYERLNDFRRQGVAIAFVSHNMQAVASLCDRAMLLRSGSGPIVSDVGTVIAAYTNANPVSSDARVRVLGATLSSRTRSGALRGPIPPGTTLTLDLELLPETELPRCGLGLQVTRSDGLTIFMGASNIGGESVDVAAGVPLRCRITFDANVLKGTYIVGAYLRDGDKIWREIVLSGLASFVVEETTRVGGCAELHPNYQMHAEHSLALESRGSR
jgi:lipopolysaccharide transport system ATP-binding protein